MSDDPYAPPTTEPLASENLEPLVRAQRVLIYAVLAYFIGAGINMVVPELRFVTLVVIVVFEATSDALSGVASMMVILAESPQLKVDLLSCAVESTLQSSNW